MRVRITRRRVGLAVAAVLTAGFAFWTIAPYNIAASVPHLPGVTFLLHGYLKNAVRTWSLGIAPPDYIDLDDEGLVRLGANHFELGCAPCHGAPGRPRNPVVKGMLPEPPHLDHALAFKPNELYWIVRNGFKYSGMPHWPAEHRPDEPWAVAAYLAKLGEIDAARYNRLIDGEAEPPGGGAQGFGMTTDAVRTFDYCARCHGEDGQGRDGTAPRLAGQSEAYLLATLDAYTTEARPSGIMEPIAEALEGSDLARLAKRFAGMKPFATPRTIDAEPALIARGAALAERGDEGKDLPSCLSCHGEGHAVKRKPLYPRIAGQDRMWLTIWLHRWRERPLGGTRFANVMHQSARTLSDDDIRALAAYFAAGADAPD